MSNAVEISKLIYGIKNLGELATINSALKLQWSEIQRSSARTFQNGDQVTFKNKYNQTVTGRVIRINTKTVTIMTDAGSEWKVSPSLLNKVA